MLFYICKLFKKNPISDLGVLRKDLFNALFLQIFKSLCQIIEKVISLICGIHEKSRVQRTASGLCHLSTVFNQVLLLNIKIHFKRQLVIKSLTSTHVFIVSIIRSLVFFLCSFISHFQRPSPIRKNAKQNLLSFMVFLLFIF